MSGDIVSVATTEPLGQLHEALRTLVRGAGRLPFDVTFRVPTSAWVKSRRTATLNFFLFDVEERTERRDPQPRHDGQGRLTLPPRFLDVRYLVTAHATSEDDAMDLLWRAVGVLLRHPDLPEELVPRVLRHLNVPVTLRVAQEEDRAAWKAYPGAAALTSGPFVVLAACVPMDLEVLFERPLVLRRELETGELGSHPAARRVSVGVEVTGADGRPVPGLSVWRDADVGVPLAVTDERGRFVLGNLPVNARDVTVVLGSGSARQIVTFSLAAHADRPLRVRWSAVGREGGGGG